MGRRAAAILTLAALLAVASAACADDEPSATQLIQRALERWKSVRTFRATFIRRERLQGTDGLAPAEVIFLRERQEPFSIYMHWLDGPGKNRRMAYIEGRNDGKFKVTPGGALGWVLLDMAVNDPEVFKKSRHTVLEAGLGRLMKKIREQFERGGTDVRSKYKGKVTFHGRSCYRFYRYTPQKPGYYCWKAEIWFDEEFGFPLYVKLFDWQQNAFEEYSYVDFELNPDLTDRDFQIGAEPRK